MQYPAYLSLLILLSSVVVVRSQNCQLQVPANPLTAQGLATPYVLTGCNQLDFANQGAFVEAAILDPATGNIQIYSPLVINAGMTPVGNGTGTAATSAGAATTDPTVTPTAAPITASTEPTRSKVARQAASAGFYVPPIQPTLPNNAVVGIWFGSNAASLTLTGDTAKCVNGLGNSVFGQFAYCNGEAWFAAAKAAVSQGLVKLPPPGTGSGGQVCPTTHDFRIVDQDQSDNLVTTYLLIGGNTLAQNTPDNNKANPNAEVLSNASDNALVTQFIDPALGCAPFQSPCPTCPTGQGSALATDELVANFFPPAGGPALVPLSDPMVLVNGQQNLAKVNLYRVGTGQPQADDKNASGLSYCQQIPQGGIFINNNQQLFANAGSPAAGTANNLFTFLASRFSASFGPAPGLGCTGLLNVANPVTLTMDGNGVVTAATINTQVLQQILNGNGGTSNTTSSAATSATTAASSVSAGTSSGTSATASGTASTASGAQTTVATTAGQTGVLLHLTSTMSSVPSGAPTSASGDATSIPTSAGPVAQTSGAGLPTGSSSPTCTGVPTVTVTVTATACPTLASSAPSASPTTSDGDNGGWDGNLDAGWNNGAYPWKRAPFAAHRMRTHRKSRLSF